MICNFYEIKLDDSDYINYINFKTGNEFNKVIKLETNVIDSYMHTEGHGKDFSWWMEKLRLCLSVAVNGQLETTNRYFTTDEIKELIKNNKIYPIYSFYEKCDDRLHENKVEDDIKYLVNEEYGKMDIDDEYVDYFMDDVMGEVNLSEIFMIIMKYIINQKISLECYLEDWYFEDGFKQKLDSINKLIDIYNERIMSLSSGQEKSKLISKDPIEIVIEYIKDLPNIDRNNWYQEIEIERIVQVMDMIDFDEQEELRSFLEQKIVDLEDPELCYLMMRDVSWIDLNKMLAVILDSEDEWVSYDVLNELSDQLDKDSVEKLLKIIIDSKNAEINYRAAQLETLDVDVNSHGKAVIDSENVYYNYLFALDIPGADVRKHGEVIIKCGDAVDNSLFVDYIPGADVERHLDVIRAKEQEEKNKNSLKKILKK